MPRTVFSVLLALLACAPVAPEGYRGAPSSSTLSLIDSSEARIALREEVLEAELWRLEKLEVAPVRQTATGTTVEVSVRPRSSDVSIVLRIVPAGSSRAWERGAFTLVRSRDDGSPRAFRIVTREEPGCYLEVRPAADRSVMDVYHLDGRTPFRTGVIVPVPFEELITSSLERIVALTDSKVDWATVFYEGSPSEDRRVEALSTSIRALLPLLRDADDGAIDADGRFVFISSLTGQPGRGGLNCSGFVKWVVDGFYYPLRGVNTSVADAKRAAVGSERNSLAASLASRDPRFGLDWTRNLAALLEGARRGEPGAPGGGAFDLRAQEPVPYTVDLGYPVADLLPLLYRRAMLDPGVFYLGSVNDVIGSDGLRQQFHTLVLLPYFDATGVFRVRVFERAVESDLSSLRKRYPGSYVHLVRVAAEGVFSPLAVP
jgi:hypothetical protein